MSVQTPPSTTTDERLISPTFVLIVVAAIAYFTSLSMLLPVLPRYVEDTLDGDGLAIGVVVGAFAVSAALVRPLVGRLGDQFGRRPLAVFGAALAALSMAGYGLVESLPILVGFRLLTGLGEGAFFIGAATAAQDLSPDDRRGEAASFFSISIYGGLAIGPFLGEVLYRSAGAGRVWIVAAVLAGAASLLSLLIPADLGRHEADPDQPDGNRRLLHPAAIMPGTVLLLGLMGFAAFGSFLTVFLDDLGFEDAGPYFLVYGLTVLVVRIFGARVPDRFGAVRTATASLLAITAGTLLIATVASEPGLYAGTVVFSIGMSLLFPALFSLVVNQAPASERSHAVGTFSLFFDMSQGLGAPLLGIGVDVFGTDRAAFIGGAAFAVGGLVLARTRLAGMVARTEADA